MEVNLEQITKSFIDQLTKEEATAKSNADYFRGAKDGAAELYNRLIAAGTGNPDEARRQSSLEGPPPSGRKKQKKS
jgi:hypothetical protein